MTIALTCTAVLAALVFVLGFNVSRLRGVVGKAGGSQLPIDPADRLFVAIRAHGNAAEYVPTLILLFLLVALRVPAWWTAALIIAATAARLLHAAGMLAGGNLAKESIPRMIGAAGTYLFGTALAVVLLVSLW